MVDLESTDTEVPSFLNSSEVDHWLTSVTKGYSRVLGELTVIFCSDEYLLNMNREYLNHDYYTDIVTFDYSDEQTVSGDLFISVDRVADNADQLGLSFREELLRVIVHGVLHLCGLKDKSDEESALMRKAEDEALRLLN